MKHRWSARDRVLMLVFSFISCFAPQALYCLGVKFVSLFVCHSTHIATRSFSGGDGDGRRRSSR